jgi:hypothetical protein
VKKRIHEIFADRKFVLLLAYCILGPAFFAGFLFGRVRGHPFWAVFVIAVVVMAAIVFSVVGLIFWLGRKTEQQLASAEKAVKKISSEINQLSIAEAERRAAMLLSDPARCECVRATASQFICGSELPPATRRFFQEYESVRLIDAGTVARDLVRPTKTSRRNQDVLLQIGEGGEDYLLAIRQGADTVYLIDAGSTVTSGAETFPSIFHWLVSEAAVQDYFAADESRL